MENPWVTLSDEKPYVLSEDKQEILKYNNNVNKEENLIRTELIPEPYLGNPSSKIILLNLNPGFSIKDKSFHNDNDYFINSCRKNLLHKNQEYPFYLLDPKNSNAPGYKWWTQKLKELINKFGAKTLANNIFCIEFFPYHSKKFKLNKTILPSQKYNFYLLRKAIKRNALIVIMRSRKIWFNNVPELKDINYYELNSPQNPCLTPNNLDRYDELIKQLEEN